MPAFKLVDPFLNLPADPNDKTRVIDPNIARWFKDSKAMINGATIEEMVADMDESGIEFGIVTASAGGVPERPYMVGQNNSDAALDKVLEKVAGMMKQYPGRFYGCVGIDPTGIMTAVRQLERAVRDYGMNSCWMMPALVGLPPNHAVYFPVYAKCVELGIPIKINVGIPGPLRFGEVQRPMHLDEVCIAFPELMVVSTHVGHPWQMETAALLQKHANFRLITSGFAPKHVPEEIWRVANTRAGHKVMWSSDYPILPMQRCSKEGWEVPLKDNVLELYLRQNAIETFKLG